MSDFNATSPPDRESFPGRESINTVAGDRNQETEERFKIGDLIIDRYEVLSELGQGAMGVVFRCLDRTAGVEVALKALPPELTYNSVEIEDIKDNFQLVSKLVHQNIAVSKNLEFDSRNGRYYLIMEYCEGEDLRRWIRQQRKEKKQLSLEEILPIIKQIAAALDHAHSMNVVHRDIKPANIMITPDKRVKVLDFGLAAQIHSSMSHISMNCRSVSGTAPYMAPEQWRGEIQKGSADQYALAVITYEMLAGYLPFDCMDHAVLKQAVLEETAKDIPGVPYHVRSALKHAMSKEPSARFVSCSDFVDALNGKIKRSVLPEKWLLLMCIALLLSAGYYWCARPGNVPEKSPAPVAPVKSPAPVAPVKSPAPVAPVKSPAPVAPVKSPAPVAPVKSPSPAPVAVPAPVKTPRPVRDEKALAALKNRVYRQMAKVQRKKDAAQSRNFDRGQGVGEHLDALGDNFNVGAAALKNEDFSLAENYFSAAEKEADWILANAPLRDQARKLFEKVRTQKNASEEYKGAVLAAQLYKNAGAQSVSAGKDYDSGNFKSAVSKLQSALAGYKTVWERSRQASLKDLLARAEKAGKNKEWTLVKEIAMEIYFFDEKKADELASTAEKQIKLEQSSKKLDSARKAKAKGEWQQVFDLSLAVLASDNSNKEALALKNEAENKKCTALFYSRKYAEAWRILSGITSRTAETELILGLFYNDGYKQCRVDRRRALQHFQKSAQSGNVIAKGVLAGYLRAGEVCAKQTDAAAKIHKKIFPELLKLADSGDPLAQVELGACYAVGSGVAKDPDEASKWYLKAAEQGYASGQLSLGYCYNKGIGVPRDLSEAAKYYFLAAEQGSASALFNLGNMYLNGSGVAKDPHEAAKYFRMAAEQGLPHGQGNLGYCYNKGIGVPRDLEAAVKWYYKAAEQGLDIHQANLAICYEEGMGVASNLEEAVKWYRKAAAKGNQRARESLKRLGKE